MTPEWSEEARGRSAIHIWGVEEAESKVEVAAMEETLCVRGCHVQNTGCPLRHFIEHVADNEVVSVGSDLCRLWTEFGHGPKTKFVVLVVLYIFCLSLMAIRIVD